MSRWQLLLKNGPPSLLHRGRNSHHSTRGITDMVTLRLPLHATGEHMSDVAELQRWELLEASDAQWLRVYQDRISGCVAVLALTKATGVDSGKPDWYVCWRLYAHRPVNDPPIVSSETILCAGEGTARAQAFRDIDAHIRTAG
jgi:hypothetical protein